MKSVRKRSVVCPTTTAAPPFWLAQRQKQHEVFNFFPELKQERLCISLLINHRRSCDEHSSGDGKG